MRVSSRPTKGQDTRNKLDEEQAQQPKKIARIQPVAQPLHQLENFYTPKDNTTQEYVEATDKLGDFLPDNFLLNKSKKELFGVANLELNPDLVKPIKRIPLFSKLEKGEYEVASSKSDKTNIQASIKFFKNNLASFVQYKEEDDISWATNQHRPLVAEISEYYATKEKASFKSRFNAITRIFKIAYETKNYDLYNSIH